jgi:hypothetical protein
MVKETFSTSNRKEILTIGAANSAEKEKKIKYADYETYHKKKVIPFGLSSSGEFGECALKLLSMIQKISKNINKPLNISQFIERVSLTIETIRLILIQEYQKLYLQKSLSSTISSSSSDHYSNLLPLTPPPYLLPKQRRQFSSQQNSFWTKMYRKSPHYMNDPYSLLPPPKPPDSSSSSFTLPLSLRDFQGDFAGPPLHFPPMSTQGSKRKEKLPPLLTTPSPPIHSSSPSPTNFPEIENDKEVENEREIEKEREPEKEIEAKHSENTNSENDHDSTKHPTQHPEKKKKKGLTKKQSHPPHSRKSKGKKSSLLPRSSNTPSSSPSSSTSPSSSSSSSVPSSDSPTSVFTSPLLTAPQPTAVGMSSTRPVIKNHLASVDHLQHSPSSSLSPLSHSKLLSPAQQNQIENIPIPHLSNYQQLIEPT